MGEVKGYTLRIEGSEIGEGNGTKVYDLLGIPDDGEEAGEDSEDDRLEGDDWPGVDG